MKRVASIFIYIVIIITLLPCHVAAWVPSTSFFCQVDTDAVPDGAVYIDLLMPIPSDNEAYTEINQPNADTYGFSNDSEIVKYNQDGFVSYTFHIIDASSDLTISDSIDYNSSIDRISKYDFEYCQKNFKKIKFAYLDKDGNIISVSNSVKITTLRAAQLRLKLSGDVLTKDVSHGPPVFLIIVIPVALIIAAITSATILIIVIIKRVKKNT